MAEPSSSSASGSGGGNKPNSGSKRQKKDTDPLDKAIRNDDQDLKSVIKKGRDSKEKRQQKP